MVLNLEQQKGDRDHLDGRITVYAQIEIDPSELISVKHPIASMIHNGLLVAQGNFREQGSLKDFLKSEMGLSMDEGLEEGLAELLDKMNGIDSALDPQKLKDRLENMDGIEEFIPTPAKIVPFHTIQEILDQEGDVFYTGKFKNIGNAVLAVNSLPILYQSKFREQEMQKVRNEIEMLISQVEKSEPAQIINASDNIEEKLLKEFIPNMLYCRKEPASFNSAVNQFRLYMTEYRFKEDVDDLITIISAEGELNEREYKLLELYAKKIASVKREDFSAAELYNREIHNIKNQH